MSSVVGMFFNPIISHSSIDRFHSYIRGGQKRKAGGECGRPECTRTRQRMRSPAAKAKPKPKAAP